MRLAAHQDGDVARAEPHTPARTRVQPRGAIKHHVEDGGLETFEAKSPRCGELGARDEAAGHGERPESLAEQIHPAQSGSLTVESSSPLTFGRVGGSWTFGQKIQSP